MVRSNEMSEKPMKNLDKLIEILKDGEVHTRSEIMTRMDIASIGVLRVYVYTLRKNLPETEGIVCELVQGRSIGYRWIVLKRDQRNGIAQASKA